MAFVTITCPQCGGQAQIEAGRSVMCPYCGREVSAPPADGGFAYAPLPQDMQQTAVQFAPPPQQAAMQPMPAQQFQPQQYAAPQYTQEQLLHAQQKRTNWYYTNAAMIGGQTLLFAFGVMLASLGLGLGVALILTWVLTLPFGSLFSTIMRPYDAYLDKKPFVKNKVGWSFTHLALSAGTSAAVGAILFAILHALFG